MSPRKPPKREPFSASKEVKRRARESVGSPPPGRIHEDGRKKAPKHKKRVEEETAELE